jgi:cysteinyl-tRNA synthetase
MCKAGTMMRKWGGNKIARLALPAALVAACHGRDIPRSTAAVPVVVAPSACAPGAASPVASSAASLLPSLPAAPRKTAAAPAARRSRGAGFPNRGPWLSFYGTAEQMGDLGRVAAQFRIIDIDADPDAGAGSGNFTDEQIRALRAGGRNRVISYLDLGSCEEFRTYWAHAPAPLVSCSANRAAQLGAYGGYADEHWMNPAEPEYRKLLLEYVAPRLAARGIDGFYLDNLEIVEHAPDAGDGPCDAACRQGGLDLVRGLRERFPERLIVMQNATSDVTRLGTTGGVPFFELLDGIVHEEVYAPAYDEAAERQLLAWQGMGITSREGRRLFIGTEDYVGSCGNAPDAKLAYARALGRGFSPYASDESAGQRVVCFWGF